MTLEFQLSLLKYLFQYPESKVYSRYLDETVFDNSNHKVLFKVWLDYVKKYKCVPAKPNFLEYFEREWESTPNANATPELKKALLNDIASIYGILEGDTVFIKDIILDFAQKKLTRKLYKNTADKIATGNDKLFKSIYKEMGRIIGLRTLDEEKEKNRGRDYVEDDSPREGQAIKPMSTPFFRLNRMTAAGGFYSPQLIILMKAAKAFGTGLMLRMAAWDLKRGEHVFFADVENGVADIEVRMDMTLLNCEEHEVKNHRYELKKIKEEIKKRGGKFKVVHFPGGTSTMQDMDDELELLAEKGFKPTVCYNDAIDKFVPVDKSIKENRFKIRDVYIHQQRLNDKWGMRTFSISPISTEGDKAYYTERDFGEDKYKAYNCHASFALCCTIEELQNGTMRIIPIVQRKGLPFMHNALTTCALKVNRATALIEELDSEAYLTVMDVYGAPEKGGKSRKFIDLKSIKDE